MLGAPPAARLHSLALGHTGCAIVNIIVVVIVPSKALVLYAKN